MEATILAVEDDGALAELLGDLLREEGYRVLLAGDGVAAVRSVEQH
jgi:CheY-like chemotaxis protein